MMIKISETKKIGIIGGLGPDSTLDYYRGIINHFRTLPDSINYPEIIIYSLNLTEFMNYIDNKKDSLVKWLLEKIQILYNSGVDFAAIASNTPHIVFNKLQEESPLHLISIVEETLKHIKSQGYKKVGLLGTQTTMSSSLYIEPFRKKGIEIIVPDAEEVSIIHEKIFSELEIGLVTQNTKELFLSYIQKMIQNHQIEACILGCTELPIMFPHGELGIPFINTTKIHITSIIDYCIDTSG